MTNQIQKLATEDPNFLISEIKLVGKAMEDLRHLFNTNPKQFRTHSDISRFIGKITSNPTATNEDAYVGGREYLNQVKDALCVNYFYGNTKLQDAIEEAIKETRITSHSYELVSRFAA